MVPEDPQVYLVLGVFMFACAVLAIASHFQSPHGGGQPMANDDLESQEGWK